jgi:hypothetical protein
MSQQCNWLIFCSLEAYKIQLAHILNLYSAIERRTLDRHVHTCAITVKSGVLLQATLQFCHAIVILLEQIATNMKKLQFLRAVTVITHLAAMHSSASYFFLRV